MKTSLFASIVALSISALVLAGCSSSPERVSASSTASSPPGETSGTSTAPYTRGPVIVMKDGTEFAGGTAPSSDLVVEDISRQTFEVLVDGWSVKTLPSPTLYWVDDLGGSGTVTLAPVSRPQFDDIMATTPEYATRMIARMVSPAADWDCTPSGCTGPHEFSPDWVSSPASVPYFGESYAGYGISSLLYSASFDITPAATKVTFLAYKDQPPSLGNSVLTYAGKAYETPVFDNGFFYNRAMMAASFGIAFALYPSWVFDGQNYVPSAPPSIASGQAEALEVATASEARVQYTGLAAPWETAPYLPNSALTYFSSPTTGCGAVALCVPIDMTTQVTSEISDSPAALCLSGATAGTSYANGDTTPARLNQTRSTVTLPAPINQYGAWGPSVTSTADLEQVPPGGGASGGGLPPTLLSGTVTLTWTTTSFLSIDTTFPVLYSGSVSQDDTAPVTSDNAVSEPVATDLGAWGPC